MPSTSAQQAKFMTACAKGWDAESCPPMAVARKFHEADKKEGKYLCKEGCEHGAKKESTALDDAGTVVARRQTQHQFVEIETGQHHIAVQTRRFVDGFRRCQLRQLAALHAVEADVLQRL